MCLEKIKIILKPHLNSATLIKILIGLIVLGAFFYINIKTIDPDLGWHLRVGQTIFSDQAVPRFDQFSFTMPGFRFVYSEWLTEFIFWFAYSKNLWWLIIIIFTLFSFAPFFSWLWRARSIYSFAFILLVATALIQIRLLGIRPQILSFFLFWLVFEILFWYWYQRRQKKQKILLFFLPLIFLLWANLHAGFAAGLALFGFLILGNWWQNHKNKNPQSQNFEITIFLISFAVTLINPYGLQLYREIFSVLLSSDTAKYIAEWQTPLAFGSLYLEIFMAAVLFLLIKNYKKYPLGIFLAAAVFSLAFLKSIRMMLPFLVIAMPLAVSGIEFVKQDIFAARSKKPFSPKQISLIKIAGWTILVVVLVFFNWELTHYQFFPMPEKAALFLQKYLEQNKTAHNVLNDYAWGGYLLWKIPDLRVFIDGRMDHWTDQNGNSAMKDYVKIFSVGDSADWQGILKKWQITDIIMPNPDTSKDDGALSQWLTITLQNHFSDNGAINQFLFPASTQDKRKEIETTLLQNGWKTIYQDQIAVILSCGNCGY